MMITYYHQQNYVQNYDAFVMQKKKSFKKALNSIGPTIEPYGNYVFEVTTNVVDTNTLFTVFQIRVNIFQSIAIKSICREFCY